MVKEKRYSSGDECRFIPDVANPIQEYDLVRRHQQYGLVGLNESSRLTRKGSKHCMLERDKSDCPVEALCYSLLARGATTLDKSTSEPLVITAPMRSIRSRHNARISISTGISIHISLRTTIHQPQLSLDDQLDAPVMREDNCFGKIGHCGQHKRRKNLATGVKGASGKLVGREVFPWLYWMTAAAFSRETRAFIARPDSLVN